MFFVSLSILFSISSCFGGEDINSEREIIYAYNQLSEEQRINWDDILSFDGYYHVYIYSLNCTYCKELRNDIVCYALNDPKTPIYFVCYEDNADSIPLGDVDDVDLTIGATNIDEIFLGATPALIGIDNHTVIFYVCGSNTIREILEI
ncbi:MAG: hypothetical protein LUB56_01565 [Coprobacillus sp.]|nr:hypothetical protein [Coprobacillus sp.]